MKIIVIVVTYNGMKWYKNCFDSIRNSSIHTETVVIDNNSDDGTVQFIKENYPDIKLIESNINLGFGKANNIGLKYAIEQNADFVFLLNQDAWVRPDTIEKLAVKLKENPEYGILSPVHLSGDESRLDFGFIKYIDPSLCPDLISDSVIKKMPNDKIYSTYFVNAALWLISKECINKIGGFAPIFTHYGEDVNYTQRCAFNSLKVGIYPEVYGMHDRKPKDNSKPSVKTLTTINKIECLTIIMDINGPFVTAIKICLQSHFILFIKNLLCLSLTKMSAHAIMLFFIVISAYPSYKERKQSKKEYPNFL